MILNYSKMTTENMTIEIMVKEFNIYQKRAHLAPGGDCHYGGCASWDFQTKSQILDNSILFSRKKTFIGPIILYL